MTDLSAESVLLPQPPVAEVPMAEVPVAPPPPPRPALRAPQAFSAFGLLLGMQFVAGIAFVISLAMVAAATGADLGTLMARSSAALLIVASLASAGAVFLSVRLWAWHLVKDRTRDGLGLFVTSRQETLAWALAGASLAALYLFTATSLVRPDPSMPLGPLAAAASAGGLSRIVWAVIALLSLCTIAARVVTGSLVPPLAVHVAYNGVIVVMLYSM